MIDSRLIRSNILAHDPTQSHIRSRVRFAQRLLDPDTLTSDDPRDIVLDILEELENKKAGKKVGEEKKSGKGVEGEVDEKKKVSATTIRGRKKGSGQCCTQVAHVLIPELDFIAPLFRLVLRPNKERSENGRKRPRSPKKLGGRRNVRSPTSQQNPSPPCPSRSQIPAARNRLQRRA